MNRFRARLLRLSKSLTASELEQLKFLCQDDIPAGRAEKITEPFQFFSELEQLGKLSDGKLCFLSSILVAIGRIDLSKKLLQIQGKNNVLSLLNEILCLIFFAKSYTKPFHGKIRQFRNGGISGISRDANFHKIVFLYYLRTKNLRLQVNDFTGEFKGCGQDEKPVFLWFQLL